MLQQPTTNPNVRITNVEVLSDDWFVLRKATFDYRNRKGHWSQLERETYDRGDGATILLTDWERRTVLLTRQFRAPAYLNGHDDGMLIETPAGLLDGDNAEATIRRETEEETGYRIDQPRFLFTLFMSPASVTERVSFFHSEYSPSDRASSGGGIAEDGEDIEVLEVELDEAYRWLRCGEIQDGKTMLLLQWAQLREASTASSSHLGDAHAWERHP